MNPKRIAILAVLAAVLMLGFCSRCVSHESGSKSGKRMREGEPSAYLMMHNVTKKNNCFGVESYERHGIADIDYYPARMLRFDPGYYEGATYAEFELQDDYERLLFAAGTDRAGNDERSVLAVFGDGKKLMEHLFVEYSVPEQFELDIKGVKTIRFEIMTGKGGTIVADATLWKSARKAHPLKPLTKAEAKPTELVNELPPYHAGGSHTLVGPTRLTDDEWRPKMNINGIQYESGIVMGAWHGGGELAGGYAGRGRRAGVRVVQQGDHRHRYGHPRRQPGAIRHRNGRADAVDRYGSVLFAF